MTEKTDIVSQIEALHRSALTTFGRAHMHYVGEVRADLEEHYGIEVCDSNTSSLPAPVRASVLWLVEDGDTRAEWTETDGWTLYDLPQCPDVPVHAPMAILADPPSVAQWISSTLHVHRHPSGDSAQAPRNPTRRSDPSVADLEFEANLVAFAPPPADRYLTPRPVSAPAQPRTGFAWNEPMTHHCLSCPPESARRPWTRQAAAWPGRIAITRTPAIAYTAWCDTCHPDRLHMRSADWDRIDHKLVRAHEHGEIPGSLLLTPRDKLLCPACLDPWTLFPGASLPLTCGLLEEIGLTLHPCPWCWAADERSARHAQDQALAHNW